ncbi:hypothetical protein NBRC116494_26790 [Aurantivibrio plasticivorans]
MSDGVKQTSLYESLSALIDNEASELEVHRVLAESEKDEAIRTRWHRYQLARTALHGEKLSNLDIDIADSVRNAIAGEALIDQAETDVSRPGEVEVASSSRLTSSRFANLGRFAIAAGVACVALVGVQQFGGDSGFVPGTAPALVSEAPSNASDASAKPARVIDSPFPAVNLQAVSQPIGSSLGQGTAYQSPVRLADPSLSLAAQPSIDDEERIRLYLQELMMQHAEHSAQNSNSGLMPFVRVSTEFER